MSKGRHWLDYVVSLIFILLVSQNTLKISLSLGLISTRRRRRGLDGGGVCCPAAHRIVPCEGDVRADLGIHLLDVQVWARQSESGGLCPVCGLEWNASAKVKIYWNGDLNTAQRGLGCLLGKLCLIRQRLILRKMMANIGVSLLQRWWLFCRLSKHLPKEPLLAGLSKLFRFEEQKTHVNDDFPPVCVECWLFHLAVLCHLGVFVH